MSDTSKECIYCHDILLPKVDESSTIKSVASFKCQKCNVLYNNLFGFTSIVLNFSRDTVMYQIQLINIGDGWATYFYIGSGINPALEFYNLFWIFPSNMEYWVNRFEKLVPVS